MNYLFNLPKTLSVPQEKLLEMVCTKFPNVIIGGSISLMTCELIGNRKPHDIDFIVNREDTKEFVSYIKDLKWGSSDFLRTFLTLPTKNDGMGGKHIHTSVLNVPIGIFLNRENEEYFKCKLYNFDVNISYPFNVIDAKRKYINHPRPTSYSGNEKHIADLNEYESNLPRFQRALFLNDML